MGFVMGLSVSLYVEQMLDVSFAGLGFGFGFHYFPACWLGCVKRTYHGRRRDEVTSGVRCGGECGGWRGGSMGSRTDAGRWV